MFSEPLFVQLLLPRLWPGLTTAQGAAGVGAGVRAMVYDDFAVYDHVIDAEGVLLGVITGRGRTVVDGGGARLTSAKKSEI